MQKTGVWEISKRGLKKFITDTIGLGAALLIVGIREIPVDQIMAKLRS